MQLRACDDWALWLMLRRSFLVSKEYVCQNMLGNATNSVPTPQCF
jgi:hypothetical protein